MPSCVSQQCFRPFSSLVVRAYPGRFASATVPKRRGETPPHRQFTLPACELSWHRGQSHTSLVALGRAGGPHPRGRAGRACATAARAKALSCASTVKTTARRTAKRRTSHG